MYFTTLPQHHHSYKLSTRHHHPIVDVHHSADRVIPQRDGTRCLSRLSVSLHDGALQAAPCPTSTKKLHFADDTFGPSPPSMSILRSDTPPPFLGFWCLICNPCCFGCVMCQFFRRRARGSCSARAPGRRDASQWGGSGSQA
jgi:hypothetical protein